MEIETKIECGVKIQDIWINGEYYTRILTCTMEDAKYYAKVKGFDDSDDICRLLHGSRLRSKYIDYDGFYYVVEM